MSLKKSTSTILVSSESPNINSTKRLLIEAKKLKLKANWINPYEFKLPIPLTLKLNKTFFFHRTTGIRYDDFDLLVSRHHEFSGAKIINPITPLEIFRDKSRQALFFNQHHLESIETISYRGKLTKEIWEAITKLSPKECYILKMIRGNQGIGVNFINGLHSLKSILETFHALKDQKFIIQPFVSHQTEWRAFVIKNELIAIIERKLTIEDFRGNASRSIGKLRKKIPLEIEREIIRASTLSNLDYCGIDILIDKNKTENQYQFLEINPVPGFLQLEELSKMNIARELITRLI